MTYQEGTLAMSPCGRWEIARSDGPPIVLTSGDVFRVGVAGQPGLSMTRMEYAHRDGGAGAYYSVDGYPLAEGLKAAIGGNE